MFFLLSIASAQNGKLPSQRKHIVFPADNQSGFYQDQIRLKSGTDLTTLIDSSFIFDWDTASNTWIANFKNTYKYDEYGQVITKHGNLISIDGKTSYPYSLEQRSYYTDGGLKEQTNSYCDNQLNGYQGNTRYQYKFNIFGFITDLYVFFPVGDNSWYCGTHYHQVFNKYNKLTEYYEYTAGNSSDELKLTRKQFTYYTKFTDINSFVDSIWDEANNKFICNELEQYHYDENGAEKEFFMWRRYSANLPLQLAQKIETSYNTEDATVTKTYYSYDTVTDSWNPESKTSVTYFYGQIIESKGFIWKKNLQQWIPTYWNSTTYGTAGYEYDELIVRYWNDNTQQLENSIRNVNTFDEDLFLIEHAVYEWKSGWRYIESTIYNRDPDNESQTTTYKSWNDSDSALRNARLWVSYFSSKETKDYTIDTTALKVIPNPAKNVISVINCPTDSYAEIFNINGVRILVEDYVSNYGSFDISDLAPGVYVIKFTSNGISRYRKFVKQN